MPCTPVDKYSVSDTRNATCFPAGSDGLGGSGFAGSTFGGGGFAGGFSCVGSAGVTVTPALNEPTVSIAMATVMVINKIYLVFIISSRPKFWTLYS